MGQFDKEARFTGPVGFCIEGMSGPGSGAWSRLTLIVPGLVAAGLDVHILGEANSHDEATSWGASSVELIPKLSKLKRLMGRGERISAFARATGSRVIHLEAPPFTGSNGVPTIVALHDLRHFGERVGHFFSAQRLYSRYVMPRYAPNISGWMALSEFGVADIQSKLRIPSDKIFLVPPIVAGPEKTATRFPPEGVAFVLALGHLEERKNLETLVRASKEVSWPPALELWIAGKDQGSLAMLRKLAGPENTRVKFLGPVNEAEKWRLLREAAMVVVPSLFEGFGIVAVEGPLVGSIALVSDRTALPELASHPLAQIPAQDYTLWAERIATLNSSPQKVAEILAAQVKHSSSFEAKSVIPRLLSMYEKLGA